MKCPECSLSQERGEELYNVMVLGRKNVCYMLHNQRFYKRSPLFTKALILKIKICTVLKCDKL